MTVTNGTGTFSCHETVGASVFWVNVTDGTVAGTECEALSFAENVEGDYTLNVTNGANAKGNYSMVVDRTSVPSQHYDGPQPIADAALYSVTVELVFETDQLHYRTDVRVAPGESDA
ncbi:hypothetical protein VB773_13040 [Haloarculaceae archaeon H-GB2-1]|nr:hypothetical protein [Haloarculaceae archaeon H-GB2-1]